MLQPRLACDLQLDRVTVELRELQYFQLVQCSRSLELLTKGLRYRRFRPEGGVKSCDARSK